MNDSEKELFKACLEAIEEDCLCPDCEEQRRKAFLNLLDEIKAEAWAEGYISGCWDTQHDPAPDETTTNPYLEEEAHD